MELVYNWHITEKCNYSCKYCFAKWDSSSEIWKNKEKVNYVLLGIKNSYHSPLLEPIIKSKFHPSIRINFAGGEPLLLGKYLVDIIRIAKGMGLRTSVITNGSLLIKFSNIAKYIDIIGISIDSFAISTNKKLGRSTMDGKVLDKDALADSVRRLKTVNPQLMLKFNIVVTNQNYDEIIIPELVDLEPDKIKILRQMPFGADQKGISDEMFNFFKESNKCSEVNIAIEDNLDMTHSYLMIDPAGRFFQNGNNDQFYSFSKPINNIGFNNALNSIALSCKRYTKRYLKGEIDG